MRSSAAPRHVKIAAVVLCVLVLSAFAEACLALLPTIAGKTAVRGILYFPPEIRRSEFERYIAIRDPLLGWPARSPGSHETTNIAPRPSPAFPSSGTPCISAYGESFTYGEEVGDADAWSNVLAMRLHCPVHNFGVGGYGTDQAFLRFRENVNDRAPTTILGIFADNPLRNVNQYRYFLTGANEFALKPRFVLEGQTLRLIPIPEVNYESFVAGLAKPETLWPHEVFLPGGSHGPVSWTFPYSMKVVSLLRSDAVRNFVLHRPSWIDFYRRDHDSRAEPLTVAIVAEFDRLARSTGKRTLVILYPSPAGYEFAQARGASPFAPLIEDLRARGIHILDLTAPFARHLGGRNFCELVTRPAICHGHFNAEGNRVVANAVEGELRR